MNSSLEKEMAKAMRLAHETNRKLHLEIGALIESREAARGIIKSQAELLNRYMRAIELARSDLRESSVDGVNDRVLRKIDAILKGEK